MFLLSRHIYSSWDTDTSVIAVSNKIDELKKLVNHPENWEAVKDNNFLVSGAEYSLEVERPYTKEYFIIAPIKTV